MCPAPTPPDKPQSGRRLNGSGAAWKRERELWRQQLPMPCPRCNQLVFPWDMWDLDHVDIPDVIAGPNTKGRLRPAHRACNRKAGRELGQAIKHAGIAEIKKKFAESNSEFESEAGLSTTPARFFDGATPPQHSRPDGISPSQTEFVGIPGDIAANPPITPIFPGIPGINPPESDIRADHGIITPDYRSITWAKPWLRDVIDVPGTAQWPRLMSKPHPEAVGSYGAEAVAWLAAETGIDLRWWQRLAITRALEHDASGQLVWTTVVLSTARQVGKSWLVRALALWRLNAAELFGEPQLVLHTGKDLNVCREIHRPGRVWAKVRGWPTRETNGQEEITAPDGSRWIVRGNKSVYGYPSSMALADEAWAMSARLVDDGLEPTMAERQSPQLVLLSTAHRAATSLMLTRRAGAIDEWADPRDSLLLEWSAMAGAELSDRDAWRQASPHWTPGRERLIEARYRRVEAGISDPDDAESDPVESFRSQVLNIWPRQRVVGTGRDEALVLADVWAEAADLNATAPPGPVVVAIEDWYGLGAAACVAARLDGNRVLVWGEAFRDRAEAVAWADTELHSRENRDGSTVIVGATLNPPAVAEALGMPAVGATVGHTRIGLPLVRAMVNSGALIHGGDKTMSGQVTACRVVARDGGLVITNRGVRGDLVRAMAWAVMACNRPATAPLPFFVY